MCQISHAPPGLVLTALVSRGRSVKSRGTVQAFDVLCKVQSDKASVEITSPFDGVLKEILVKEEVSKVGEPLCVIEMEDGEDADPAEAVPSKDRPGLAPVTSPSTGPTISPLADGPAQPTTPRRHHPLDPNKPTESV